jgi:hypothetical protein
MTGNIPSQASSLTDKGRGYKLNIAAACSRTLIIRSSSPQFSHCNDLSQNFLCYNLQISVQKI